MGDRLGRLVGLVRPAAAVLAAAAALAVVATAGCGVRPTGVVSAGGPVEAAGNSGTITVYLARGKHLEPVVRPELPGHPYLALSQLSVPVTAAEKLQGLHTEVRRPLVARLVRVASRPKDDAVLVVDLPDTVPRRPVHWSSTALAQIACTAEAVPGISSVRLWSAPDADEDGWGRVRCGDYRDAP
ncbi:hypothetical protein [Actinomadura montaniterrae]|uniref:GerMN domain-containing protein n=1 Tax=Actinomadura montaniterrae TaxID=1803903 RepID=A0A6L3VTH8_9ACTN|nr:hypothetical protein [Actinomadura montaniterrae]KAB2378951.1 hypothetical protein F9B16_22540 [Actinomadura montaniterrae]